MKRGYYKGLYLIASLYDAILGFGFLFFYRFIYQIFNMNLPENTAYLSLCAIFIGIYGILLFWIYMDLDKSRKLIIYASMIKFSFAIVVFYYLFFMGVDYVDMPFRILGISDLIFGILFLESLRFIKK